MKSINAVKQPSPLFVKTVGLEAEGWSYNRSSEGTYTEADGVWTNDAGLNQCEAVTNPQPSREQAVAVLRTMTSEYPIRCHPFRPFDLMHNAGRWQPGPAYEARVAGLRNESPEYNDWVKYKMPNHASLQVSVSGDFDSFGDEAAFVVSMINDVAVKHAAEIHNDFCCGFGHLGLWQFFAHPERFPQPGRWFGSGVEMVDYIESVRRLVRKTEGGFILNPPGEFQDVYCASDLKNMWWYARPKRDDENGSYLEIRHLPSMPIEVAEMYLDQVVDMIELLLGWFFGENAGRPVLTREDALPAYRLLHDCFGRYVPDAPLDTATWMRLMQKG